MAKFGTTYWGKKWLEALKGIDHSNRLPRGRTYATHGLAYDIQINNQKVTAKVRGSRLSPYSVDISLAGLSKDEKEIVRSSIRNSPSVLSQFLNRHLSQELHETLTQKNIKLFPSSWDDITAHCSCPDWAVPCKHIAAVIYLIANEIDKNPFLVFTLNNCNLADIVDDKVDQARRIPLFDSFEAPTKDEVTGEQPPPEQLDFSQIPPLAEYILSILPPNQSFYYSDYREILKKAYAYWQKKGYTKPYIKLPKPRFKAKPKQWKTTTIDYNEYAFIEKIIHKNGECQLKNSFLDFDLLHILENIEPSKLHTYNPELQFLQTLKQFSLALCKQGAIIPHIYQNQHNYTLIRWQPALFNQTVNTLFQQLASLCPPNLATLKGNKLSQEEQVTRTISTFLGMFVVSTMPRSLSRHLKERLGQFFFQSTSIRCDTFETVELPRTMYTWLSRLYMSQQSHTLCLKVQDKKDGFHITIQVKAATAKTPKPLQQALKSSNSSLRMHILTSLAVLGEYIPGLNTAVDINTPLILTLEEFSSLFLQVMPTLRALGITMLLPRSLKKILTPTLRLNLSSEEGVARDSQGFLELSKMLNFDWRIAIGDKQLTTDEFKKIAQKSRGLVKIMDQYIILDDKELEKLLKAEEKASSSIHKTDILQAALAEEYNGAEVHLDANLKKMVTSLTTFTPAMVPQNLRATLRPYQERGFSWLVQNIQTGFGSIIADDMGLGKTIQVISTILHCKNAGLLAQKKVLIVAPTSLLSNWQHEIKRFAPDLSTCLYHGQERKFSKKFEVAITSYGIARKEAESLNNMNLFLLVLDEAQNIKNPITGQTKAIKSIKADHRIAMSGTPVENRLLEYWSIFDFTNKHYLGTPKKFKDRFANPIEKDRDKDCLQQFTKITSPFMLRRLKSDKAIIKDLPDKIENNRYCCLTTEQAVLYNEVVRLTMKKIENSEGIERKGLVFKLLNALKQICNHPAQYDKTTDAQIAASGKLQALVELLTAIHDSNEKALIFTQYVEMGTIISRVLEEQFSLPAPFLHGGLSRKKRDALVHAFQNSSEQRTLIVSLKAGGTGLNLTAANHVIHYDLWWNPAVEAQATDRAYRIGQKKNVMVHRLLTTGTFEEQIDEMIQHKKELANLAVSTGERWISEFSNEQLKDLVTIRQQDS